MDHGIDDTDPFGVGALFVSQSMAARFDCADDVDELLRRLLVIETPQLPDTEATAVLGPVDELLNWIEGEPALLELVRALFHHGAASPARTPVAQALYRSVLWTMMRHDPVAATPEVLQILRDATPGARLRSRSWPPHEFFAAVVLLVYLGDHQARLELDELLAAARELEYHVLTPVLEWYLDHSHSVPAR